MIDRRFLVASLAAVPVILVGRQTAEAAMDAYRWEKRPLLVFAPASDDERLATQRQALSGADADLADRDMVVLVAAGDQLTSEFGPQAAGLSARALRARYGVAEGEFAVILVGKDGGAKLRVREPVDPGEIFRLIDGMPMRRREMRGG